MFTKTATLRRTSSSGTDEYGNLSLVEATEDVPCHVRTLSSDETVDGVTSTRWKLYVSPAETIEASDRVTIDGELFEIVTDPVALYNPRTRLVESVQCQIERTA